MSTDQDPDDAFVAHLRSLWREENEAAELPSLSLDDADESTQAVVGWLQSAWSEETLELKPQAAPEPQPRRTRPVAMAFLMAAAAAALLFFIPKGPAHAPRTPTPVVTAANAPTEPTIFEAEHFTSRSDGIEIVTGSVRVVLVQPSR